MAKNTLTHWGVLGMKWGVRRYQNKDGSLTPAGKKRYGDSADAVSEDVETRKQKILKSRSARELYKNADLFSDQELQTAYNRLNLERNIANLAPKEVSKGEQFVNNVVNWGQKVNSMADVGIKTYNNVARIYNAFSENGRSNPLPQINGGDKKKDKK